MYKLVLAFDEVHQWQFQLIRLSKSEVTALLCVSPPPLAKTAGFTRGLPIRVEVVEGGVFLRTAGKPKLTSAQKLKAFDPAIQGGEVMSSGRFGSEVF